MAIKKNQHYVPKFYLKRFSNSGNSISIYLKNSARYIPVGSISGQCYKEYFYGKNLAVENALSVLEGKFSSSLKEFCNTNEFDSIAEDLFLFSSIQNSRTTKTNDFLKTSISHAVGSVWDKFVELNNLSIPSNSVEFNVNNVVNQAVVQSIIHRHLLYDLGIHKITNTSAIQFITSDHPVILLNPGNYNRPELIGLACAGLQILIPVSPTTCIFMYDKDYYTPLINGGKHESYIREDWIINNINQLCAFNAYSTLFGTDKVPSTYFEEISKGTPIESTGFEQVNTIKDLGNGKFLQRFGTIPHILPTSFSKGYFILKKQPKVRKRYRDPQLIHCLKAFEKAVFRKNYKATEFEEFMLNETIESINFYASLNDE